MTSTMELMRGSASPFLTRRSSASLEGRVFVGSQDAPAVEDARIVKIDTPRVVFAEIAPVYLLS